MLLTPEARKLRGRIGAAERYGDTVTAAALRSAFAESTLAARIKEVVDAAPPLSAEQRNRLAGLLLAAEPASAAVA